MIDESKNMVIVPEGLRKTRYKVVTPLVQEDNVEESFYRCWCETSHHSLNPPRIYLPVFWSEFYFRDGYLNHIAPLQEFLNTLPRDKKYFTVIQYDDGIMNDVSGLDLLVFSSAGLGQTDIPLLQYRITENLLNEKKDTWIYFRGNHTHPVREKVFGSGFLKKGKNFISDIIVGIDHALNEQARSFFTLCPRGYGKTSFRLFESLAVGSIPVYIYDDPVLPFRDKIDWNSIAILVHKNEFDSIEERCEYANLIQMRKAGIAAYNDFFSFEKTNQHILNHLNHTTI